MEDSTLIMNQTDYNKCPVCHSEGEVSSRSILDVMNEQSEKFNKRKK